MPDAPAALVYLLRCRDGTLYCGWTTDVAKRLATHNRGAGAAYTRARRPVKLVWHETCADRSAALRREWQIKQLTRPEKLRLIAAARRRKPG
jgi:putative endonuclease